jgi:hypothetical protein
MFVPHSARSQLADPKTPKTTHDRIRDPSITLLDLAKPHPNLDAFANRQSSIAAIPTFAHSTLGAIVHTRHNRTCPAPGTQSYVTTLEARAHSTGRQSA